MANYGKIARLPRKIRDELNRRLDDGEAGVDLVVWLNQLPAVKKVLRERFGGRPINEVNLTEWKNGGYANWQATPADEIGPAILYTTFHQEVGQRDLEMRPCETNSP